jgi:hypothetical protein
MVEGEKAELGEEAGIDIKQINGKTNATYKDEADAGEHSVKDNARVVVTVGVGGSESGRERGERRSQTRS